MKVTLQQICFAMREMCKGSNSISLLSSLIAPIVLYFIIIWLGNSDLFWSLVRFPDKSEFDTDADYLHYLEGIMLDKITIIVPIISTVILLIPSHVRFKNNPQLRLLPIKNWVKIAAYVFIVLVLTAIAISVVTVLDYAIQFHVHRLYYEEAIAIQESMGDLYKRVDSRSVIFWPNNEVLFIGRKFSGIISLSLFFNLLLWILFHLFKKFSLIKSIIGIFLLLGISFNVRSYIDASFRTISVSYNYPIAGYNSFYYVYVPLLIILFLITIYYQLKQREV